MDLTREKLNFYEQFLIAVINELPYLGMRSGFMKQVKVEFLSMIAVRDRYRNTNHSSMVLKFYQRYFDMSLKDHAQRLGLSTKTLERYRQIYISEFYMIISNMYKDNVRNDMYFEMVNVLN